jgi:hypothetical protein
MRAFDQRRARRFFNQKYTPVTDSIAMMKPAIATAMR